MIKYNHEIRVRNVSADICSLFEELLDKYDIVIPDDERLGDDDEARILGRGMNCRQPERSENCVMIKSTCKYLL